MEPGFGPRDENEAINGAGILNSFDLYITPDGDLKSFPWMSCYKIIEIDIFQPNESLYKINLCHVIK